LLAPAAKVAAGGPSSMARQARTDARGEQK